MGHTGVMGRKIHRTGGYRNSPLPPTRQITSEVNRLRRCSTVFEVSIRLCWAVALLEDLHSVRLEVLPHLTIAPLHARRLERSALIPLWGVMVVCFIRQAASALKITAPLSAGAGSDRQCDDTPQKLPQFGKE